MFLIRPAGPKDFPGVFQLAKLLDSYNLPADRGFVRELLDCSEASFSGRLPKQKARYLFVLEEIKKPVPGTGSGRIVGCSLIVAKHGTPAKPHLWLGLETVKMRSRTLAVQRSHPVLRLGYTSDGPTEVGGLVVLPRYRKNPECCGLQISYVRFLYMGIHPGRFERKILVEYRGAMGAGNRSPFWEAIGRVFTGLPYIKADRLSVTNKEFILGLFPREPIYCALLPESVREAVGAIHPAARRAAELLKKIGFRPIPQIEPFDGGPYYSAGRRQVRLIRGLRRLRAAVLGEQSDAKRHPRESGDRIPAGVYPRATSRAGMTYLVGTDQGGFFRAARIKGKVVQGHFAMSREALRLLKMQEGERIYVCPVSG